MSFVNAGAACGRCGKSVYHAEEKNAAKKAWHKVGCFTCKTCNFTLSSTTVAEAMEEGEIYCKSCYGKQYGPHGYGFGAGAGTLSMDAGSGQWASTTGPLTAAGMAYMGGNRCPRCGGSVYHAEEVLGAGMSWHRSCFNCKTCNKKLDSTTCQENEREIYCTPCYGRHFGPKGYGFGGGAGALTNTGVVTNLDQEAEACYGRYFGPKGYGFGGGAGALTSTGQH